MIITELFASAATAGAGAGPAGAAPTVTPKLTLMSAPAGALTETWARP